MTKIKQAFKLLQDSGNFEPSQLHEGNDRLWITEPLKLLLLDY